MGASFCGGTRILTTRGRVRVEKLRLTDQVLTLQHGILPIRWIGQRVYGRHFARLSPNSIPVKIQAHAIDDGVPSRDLFLSPLHNLFIDGILVPAETLLNGSTITRCEEMDPIAYYNIEMPVHAVVLAEDMPAESYIDRGDRAMFMNSTSSGVRDEMPSQGWKTCAPILQSGPLVDRIRARIALRAGITEPEIMERPQGGPLSGKVEWVDRAVLSGWAWLPDHPDVPVVLEVMDKGTIVAVTVADQFRSDLRRAGIGNGHHAFHVELPRPLDPREPHELTVRRAADGKTLNGCPFSFSAIAPSSALTDLDLAAMIEEADLPETLRVLEWLERQAVKLHARMVAIDPANSTTAPETVITRNRPGPRPRPVPRLSGSKLARM
ncbi:Hint domain-containing protein [Acidisoma cellulosilytica]|uniref:Hint domain-containing protein n=1 Tax=Acidisoma cellulosilyticum TaxID=2802395 RepID=A0A963YXL2_9PROT|nr:Hint domain-containing protein [Acidisoma cellulosilyticum]MCB8879028.1 Hint domain-containing protein [Acidisoma cellulosilyticum]